MSATRQKRLHNTTLLLTSAFAPHTNVGYSELERAMRKFIERNGWTKLDTLLGVVRTRYTALASAPVALDGETAKLSHQGVDAKVGTVVRAIPGLVDGIPDVTITYQWKNNTVDIGGETNDSYTLVSGDIGDAITCVVTYTNTAGNISQTTGSVGAITA